MLPPKLWLCALCIDAVESGNESAVIEYLQNHTLSEQLIYGVDVDGDTALMKAAMKNHIEVVHVLLQGGADPDGRGQFAKTALMISASLGNDGVVHKLLEHPNYLPDLTAIAVRTDNAAELRDLDTRSIDYRDLHGRTALLWACYAGQINSAQRLLDHGASIDLGDNQMRTPLMWAATSSRGLPIVQLLLARGADPQRRDASGATALAWAQERGDASIIAVISHTWQEAARGAVN